MTNNEFYEDGDDALRELRKNGLGGLISNVKEKRKDPFEEDHDYKAYQQQVELFNKQNNASRYYW